MINCHSLDKIDRYGNHVTTYEKEPKSNTNFIGKTILDEWFEYEPEIKERLNSKVKTDTNIFFDGDTIEFITENFYKTNSEQIVNELINTKKWFIDKFNKFKEATNLWNDLGKIDFVVTHPGLNIFKSMPEKIVFFNNTTIHIHITLPSEIKNTILIDEEKFKKIHAKAIKILQWFEPFFISTLGSPDIMQYIYEKYYKETNKNYFAKGSMRSTISRYIGIGTYSTNEMKEGKILLEDINKIKPKNIKWWRDSVENKLLYKFPENNIGLDFNYIKYHQSGFEFRLLDGIPLNMLKDVIDVIILICEHSYSYDKIDDIKMCSSSQTWNNIVYKSMADGYNAKMNQEEMGELIEILKIPLSIKKPEILLEDFFYEVLEHLFEKYKEKETFAIKYMTKNFNKINRWENFNRIQELKHIESLEPIL